MTELHERLHWLRKQAGLTLAEVSARTGSAVGFLSDLECGRSLPSLVTLERIAAVYQGMRLSPPCLQAWGTQPHSLVAQLVALEAVERLHSAAAGEGESER